MTGWQEWPARRRITQGLEVVGLEHFEAIVTELGVLDPAAAGRLAERREVAPQLV